MKTVSLVTFLATSASAFAPAARPSASSTALFYDINAQFGVTVETGNKCPPLGALLLQDTDERALKWFQNAEIKNGRVAMLASIGYVSVQFSVFRGCYDGCILLTDLSSLNLVGSKDGHALSSVFGAIW
jgi:hypothetical protein